MQLKIENILAVVFIYLFILAVLAGIHTMLLVFFLIYAAICMLIELSFIARSEERKSNNIIEFWRSGALDSIGIPYGSFHYVFCSNEAVIEAFRTALNSALRGKLGCPGLYDFFLKDQDIRFRETRTFLITKAPETARKSGFILLCDFTRTIDIQTVRWWVLISGVRDPNKVLWRYAFAPLSTPFLILPYTRRERDPLSGLMTVYPGFFNGVDILNRTREFHFVAFETLIEVLNSFGVDTTDLKQQKGNILNINVSGGQTSFGSVVQGARNKISGIVGNQHS